MRLFQFLFICSLFCSSAHAQTDIELSLDVHSILSENCFHCHGPDANARQADLRLDEKESAFADLGGYAAVVPGDAEASELYRRVSSSDDEERMPPVDSKLKLSPAEVKQIKNWIAAGAPWYGHWAYQPLQRPAVPEIAANGQIGGDAAHWPRNEIDYFILARLQREQLAPSPEADKHRLLRRVTLDLTGLPPTLAEIDAFLADESDDAYEKVVDRLLASPRYGERMVWDWLDAARYADSNGFQGDPERTMWPWRDWVVNAMNANMPFDEFTVEQLAGDLIPDATVAQRIATGFNRNHMFNGEGGRIAEETRVENVLDRVEATATVWMGLTMTCARCHDHKYDPFTQQEYYRLFAFFNNTSENGSAGPRSGQIAPTVEYRTRRDQERLRQLEAEIEQAAADVQRAERERFPQLANDPADGELPAQVVDQLKRGPADRDSSGTDTLIKYFKETDADYVELLEKYRSAYQRRDRLRGGLAQVMIMDEREEPRDTFVLVRGLYNKRSEQVTAGVPAALPPLNTGFANRMALARWLVSAEHPLTSRVIVNRMWQMFFGRGLVASPENFGVQGEKPTHPELLDWLAAEFLADWNVKRMQRLIVTSATYRQTSKVHPDLRERDPENRLLARGPRFRLPSWMLRDQALAIGGLLVGVIGGPPVKPYQPAGIWAEATFGKKRYEQDHGAKLYRRSLYTFWRRIIGPTMFFDSSKRQTCEVKISRTNTPLHALSTLNDVTYVEAARVLAQHVMTDVDAAGERIALAFRKATARGPNSGELDVLLRRLAKLQQHFDAHTESATSLLEVGESPRDESLRAAEHAAYTAVCLLILNLDETLTKE